MWIKICGITSLEDAEMAVSAGADAVGLVFAESPRRVSEETAWKIVVKLPRPIGKIGVFVDGSFEEVLSTIQAARLTGVQLHGEDNAELARRIRERADTVSLPLHIVRVLHCESGAVGLESALQTARAADVTKTVLVDTRVAGKYGGTGVPFDWAAARISFRMHGENLRLVTAGGLNPDNVGEAIRTLRPWGVDVSSGVESSPGKKDAKRVAAFIREARRASHENKLL